MKPLSQTRVGEWLKASAPQLLETVGSFIPAPIKGTMNAIKGLVGLIPGITPTQVSDFNTIADSHEMEIIALYNEEMANARSREVELAKITGKKDKLMMILSIFGVAFPAALILYLIISGAKVEVLVAGFIGVLVGSYPQVYSYHMGSSSGSKAKQETIDNMTSSK